MPAVGATDAVRVTVAPWIACAGDAVKVVEVCVTVGADPFTVTETAGEVEPANVVSPE